MNLTEKGSVRGNVHIKIFQGRNLIDEIKAHNLVVNAGRNAAAGLLGNGTPTKYITQVAFGTDGTDPSSLDTAITAAFNKAIASTSYPSTGVVQFDWTLELTEDNGVTIKEIGLLCSDGTLFARKTGMNIIKDNTIRLEGSWTIIF